MRDRARACYGSADQQAGGGVVHVGVGARGLLDHAIGRAGAQGGVFIDGTYIRDGHRRVVGARDGDGQRAGVGDQVARVFDGVGEHVGGRGPRSQRVGRVGDVAVAAIGVQGQGPVGASEHAAHARALRDRARACYGSADQQAGGGVVHVGVGARGLLDHAIGRAGAQGGVFIDGTYIRDGHRRVVHRNNIDRRHRRSRAQGTIVHNRIDGTWRC